MGAEAAAADAIVDNAVMQVRRGSAMDASTIAAAKYRDGLAAGVVAEHAHQLHGAIGYTGEFGLARLNRRLWQGREDFGRGDRKRKRLNSSTQLAPRLPFSA